MVSSDSSGLLGTPRHWAEVWKPAIDHEKFAGFEVISWLWIDPFVKEAEKMDLKISGYHGRTGGHHDSYTHVDNIFLQISNNLLVSTPKLIERYSHKEEKYILVHSPEMKNHNNLKIAEDNALKIKSLKIENHLRPGALWTSFSIVKELRSNGVEAGMMVDLAHLVKEFNYSEKDFNKIWNKIIRNIDELFAMVDTYGKPLPISFHIPLGLNEDSLPANLITKEMWSNLASRIRPRQDAFIVIENQQGGLDALVTTRKSRIVQQLRNARIIDLLDSTGII